MTRCRAVAGIQARTSSSRLPGKVLADVAGRPLLVRLIERARRIRGLEAVVVLTSTEPSDDAVANLCRREGAECARGSLTDVMSRYEGLLERCDPRYVVRITGDSPLVCPPFVASQLAALEAFDGDLVEVSGPPADGTLGGQGVISARALRLAAASGDPRDREHVGSFWLAEHRAELRVVALDVPAHWRRAGTKLSVDEPADLELVRAIFEHFSQRLGSHVPLEDALRWLDQRPEVASLNARVRESAANQAVRALREGAPPQAAPAFVGRWP